MSSSVSNKVPTDGPVGDGAVGRRPANDDVAAETLGGVTLPVRIAVTMEDIRYDEDVLEEAGFLKMEPDDPELKSSDGGTVLRLLYYLVYTKEGRLRLLKYKFDRDAEEGLRTGETRTTLKGLLQKRFPDLEDERLEIALDAHFAASEYVTVVGKDNVRANELQAIYRQKLAAMLGALYDDSMGRDFSCIW